MAGCTMNRRTTGPRTTVSSTAELQTTFDRLSSGETIYISPENAPYRTTRWLDVDVDDVAVFGPGLPDLVTPADRAGVGGIRIGHNRRCRNVLVRGVGFHGNRDRQYAGTRLHGIAVRDAANVTLAGNRIRRTYPLEHGDGGSGITVTNRCSNVRIVGNEIRESGDRGIQLAGSRLVVAGNHIVGGLDRAISCDLWYPDGTNHTAQHVLVSGNLMGDVVEGSLTGVARNTPTDTVQGNVDIVGNVGFGAHKSFCHVRGPEPVRNVTVQNNTSVQETDELDTPKTEKYAGVAVDPAGGRNLSIRNNEFYGYSGHGVHVNAPVRDFTIQQNTLSKPTLTGVRVKDAAHGQVTDNLVAESGKAGVRLTDASDVVVADNCVREPGGPGIDSRGSGRRAGHVVADNYLADTGRRGETTHPAIRICDDGVRVRGNTVRRNGGAGIRECNAAGANLYEANRADGPDPWHVESPDARVRNNTPPVDVHPDLEADPDRGVLAVEFDRPYARPPRLTFGRTGGRVQETSYRTDADGNFVGAEIAVEQGGTFDVFVDEG